VAVNLLFCLIVQVIILSFYLTPFSTAFQSWRSVLLAEKTGVNNRTAASH